MPSMQEIATNKLDAIPRWQFWRRWEREFWYGALLAAYANITGSKSADAEASKILDKHEAKFRRKYIAKDGRGE